MEQDFSPMNYSDTLSNTPIVEESSRARQRVNVSSSIQGGGAPGRDSNLSTRCRTTVGRLVDVTIRNDSTLGNTWEPVLAPFPEALMQSPSNSFVLEMPTALPSQLLSDRSEEVSDARAEDDRSRAPRNDPLGSGSDQRTSNDPPQPEGLRNQASSYWDQAVSQNPALSSAFRALEKYIPFLIIVVIKYLFEHCTGIFVFAALVVTFYHANSVLCREISRQSRRNVWPLLAVLVNLLACIISIYFVFSEDELYKCAIFLSIGKVNTFYDLLWYVGINDFILKFFSVIVKTCIVLLPGSVLPHRKRGDYFLFIETTNQLHRTLAPIPIWLHFLLESLHSDVVKIPAKVLGVILTAIYMVQKGKHILKAAITWKNASLTFIQSKRYGRCPSDHEVKASGNCCPICHDNFQEPTILNCKHIFCEECVTTWFDRERTCPMCRSQITDDPSWRDGSTSQFIQLF